MNLPVAGSGMDAETDMRGLLTIKQAAGKGGNEQGRSSLPGDGGYPSHKRGVLALINTAAVVMDARKRWPPASHSASGRQIIFARTLA
ncbi:hypothetical protein TomTYG75_15430 [Sphingobium sp. TomTYG75]